MPAEVNGVSPAIAGYLERQKALFAVDRHDVTIAGVHAYEYVPKKGVLPQNSERVLINLHGGGFTGCWPACADLESLPVAGHGRFRVLSLDYREAPKYHFPAASEDVAAVYRELLKTHRPENIGIYGCSAGGILTGMAVAWFQKVGLPRPGAVAILCAGLTLGPNGFGDSAFTTPPTGDGHTPPAPGASAPELAYLAGVSPTDPLAAPASSADVLRRFPPTLIVTGTRAFELSTAAYTHSQLVKLGVPAELHVWEGMFHGFFYNIDVPESRECYDVVIKFFTRQLGGAGKTDK